MSAARRGVRISGGSLRGERLEVPAGDRVRPMRTRIRESLFAILGESLAGARWLDVFSGSGAIAVEALSRGARRAVLVENDRGVLRILERNLQRLRLETRTRIVRQEAYSARRLAEEPFDVIFLDPPFGDFGPGPPDPWALVERLAGSELAASGVIGLECPGRLEPPRTPTGCEVLTNRRYGDTRLVLWRRVLGD